MAGFFVHPGAVAPYERELSRSGQPPSFPSSASVPDDATPAVSHYARLAARAGRVLEYGAGRGLLTWPMATAGASVTAVDLSTVLLEELRQRGRALPREVTRRVRTCVADMRSLRLRRTFPLVLAPSGTFLHLYNRRDVESFLEGVRHHLAPGGIFVFDLPLPQPAELEEDYDPVTQIHSRELAPGLELSRRHFFPRELEMLLHYNGFARIRLRGDFTAQRPNERTRILVVSAQARDQAREGGKEVSC